MGHQPYPAKSGNLSGMPLTASDEIHEITVVKWRHDLQLRHEMVQDAHIDLLRSHGLDGDNDGVGCEGG